MQNNNKMIDFDEAFMKSNYKPIKYKDKIIHRFGRFKVSPEETLIITIESAKTKVDLDKDRVIQGLCVDVTGTCELNRKLISKGIGKKQGVRMLFFDDTAPRPVILKLHSKKSYVFIENIWEHRSPKGTYQINSMVRGAAMIIEDIPNGKRYRCNDLDINDDFDDIIFTVVRKSE